MRLNKKYFLITLILVSIFLAGCTQGQKSDTEQKLPKSTHLLYIETHMHFFSPTKEYEMVSEGAIGDMDKMGVAKSFIMPPPQDDEQDSNKVVDYKDIVKAIKNKSERFLFLGGGGTLNPLIQKAIEEGTTEEIREEFKSTAKKIVDSGALGFGEMTALHFSFNKNRPFITADPDHELFLLLADLSAKYKKPIDMHMEIVTEDMETPTELPGQNGKNPDKIKENLSKFEKLLKHNREAKIVWQHIGWDNTGKMTPALLKQILESNPNLYLSLRDAKKETGNNSPTDADGKLKNDWLKLIKEFPDRFVVGSDFFYGGAYVNRPFPDSRGSTRNIINQLSFSLAKKLAYENVEKIYGVKVRTDAALSTSAFKPSTDSGPKDNEGSGDIEKGRGGPPGKPGRKRPPR